MVQEETQRNGVQCDCEAFLKIQFDEDTGKWVFFEFYDQHDNDRDGPKDVNFCVCIMRWMMSVKF